MSSAIRLLFSVSFTALFLASCSYSVKNVPASYTLNNKAGLVVVSITISDECAQGKGHGYAYFTEIRAINNTRQEYSIAMQGYGSERDWEKKEIECSTDRGNYYGRLVVIELPGGSYKIPQLEGITTNSQSYVDNEMPVTFTVQANKINYIGNMHYHLTKKEVLYSARDMYKRDMPYFYSKYPKFKKKKIVTDLIHIEKTD